MVRAATVAACCACCAAAAAAQTRPVVIGAVRDATTGAPVPGAVIRVVETHYELSAPESGVFIIERLGSGTWTLLVRAIGYRPTTRRLQLSPGDTVRLRVTLEPTVIQLEATVVTGTLGERSSAEVLNPTSVVHGAELDRRLAATVAGTLADAPGVSVASLGPATARPVIRGLGGDRILMLEDGQRSSDLSSTAADHAVAIDPLTARQVEVVRGPMGLMYGPSALGGVVNLIRDEIPRSQPEHLHGEASLQAVAGTPALAGGLWATGALGRLVVRAEATGRGSGDVRTPERIIAGTDATSLGFAGSAALVGERHHAGVGYRYYQNDYGVPGGFVGGHSTSVGITMRRHSLRAEAEKHRSAGPLRLLRATAAFADYSHEEREPSGSVGTSFRLRSAALEGQAHHGETGQLQGAFGLRVQLRDVATGGSLRTPPTTDWVLAGYVVEELPLGLLRLQGGLRYDVAHYSPGDTTAFVTAGGRRVPVRPRTFGSFSASLGVLWAPREALRLGVAASRAYRTPDFNELYSNGPHLAANSFDVGDPELRQETGHGLELFARWSDRRLRAEAAVFVNHLDDYIFPSSRGRAELGAQGNRPRFQYTNAGARFAGSETHLEVRASRRLVLEAGASWVAAVFDRRPDSIPVISATDTTFVEASRYPALVPPLKGRLAARYERPRWFATAGVRWSAAQQRLGDFETRTGAWATADLSAGVRLLAGRHFHTITLRADNVTDTAYRDHLDRLKEIQLQPGRSITMLYRLAL
jgi:iron complex outermembrane receptor protein